MQYFTSAALSLIVVSACGAENCAPTTVGGECIGLGAAALPISTDGTDPKGWDPSKEALIAAASSHRLIFEDDDIRVLWATVPAGAEEPYHTHPYPAVTVSVPDGSPRQNAVYRDATGVRPEAIDQIDVPVVRILAPEALHSLKNDSTVDSHLLRIEIKKGIVPQLIHPSWPGGKMPRSGDGTDPASWDTGLDGPIAAPTIHKVVYEDAVIAVEAVSTPAGASEPLHSHRYPAIKIDYSDLPAAPRVELMAPLPPHPGRNTTARPTRAILVDFKHGFSK